MRTLRILIICCLLFDLIVSCKNKPKYEIIEPPVSYQSTALGARNKVHRSTRTDSLIIFSRHYATNDPTRKFDYLSSVVEIFDKADSLIYRSKSVAQDTHEVIQLLKFASFDYDTFSVKTWGFAHNLSGVISNHLKLNIGTSPLYVYKAPINLKQLKEKK